MEERLVKKLLASMKCGSCGQHYKSFNIDVLGHSEDTWFLRAYCSTCHVQSLMVALIKEDKKPEIVTDLTEAEWGRFSQVQVVGEGDVLDMHAFLKDFDGDFSCLFGRK